MHITRLDPLRRDFVNLEIVLPDEEIQWNHRRRWEGASTEEMTASMSEGR